MLKDLVNKCLQSILVNSVLFAQTAASKYPDLLLFFFQNQICSNQIKRMDEENKTQKKQLEEAAEREAELKKEVKTLLRKIDDIESKVSFERREGMREED